MEPLDRFEYTKLISPNAELTCKYIWCNSRFYHKFLETCSIDTELRDCQGKCHKYKPTLSSIFKNLKNKIL